MRVRTTLTQTCNMHFYGSNRLIIKFIAETLDLYKFVACQLFLTAVYRWKNGYCISDNIFYWQYIQLTCSLARILLSHDAGNVGNCLTFLNGVARERYRINEYISRYQCSLRPGFLHTRNENYFKYIYTEPTQQTIKRYYSGKYNM